MSMRASVLYLYKCILRNAYVYPSVNRASIIDEIKTEFRAKRHLTDEQEIEKAVMDGVDGLRALQKYTGLGTGSSCQISL
eukprot:CAMPEP_0201521222 /NCGR_PEP_ID=MMETSP0161_2-20130828/14290_1 /ASSEMBLY_ACC=CAM_ASM_000251 /TAXON_ID=180227 /ORGANISM="Neoparamoeba aestuarina, Strain SoJaBio B1-5/56/2" /LENGTH=79 /DNA_ID=CAMNT_0047919813 /DNA_START=78 /DNA_END=317 /DNA_ORIENTATION=+